jgi:hypothetical protein
MNLATPLPIEVRYVPLPAEELAERRTRLQGLLLRGALRLVRQEPAASAAPTEANPAEVAPK